MRISAMFIPDPSEVDALVAAFPMAELVSTSAKGLTATPLPLLLERDANSSPKLLGHFARSNPHAAALEASPEALVIFMGPHGYISPSWFADRTQAPTWNFATVHMKVRITMDHSPAASREAVDRLTEHMERDRPRAWSVMDMGARYEQLLPHVIAFRAEVLDIQAKFKLGQNERPDVLEDALEGVCREGDTALETAMRRANAHRLVTKGVR